MKRLTAASLEVSKFESKPLCAAFSRAHDKPIRLGAGSSASALPHMLILTVVCPFSSCPCLPSFLACAVRVCLAIVCEQATRAGCFRRLQSTGTMPCRRHRTVSVGCDAALRLRQPCPQQRLAHHCHLAPAPTLPVVATYAAAAPPRPSQASARADPLPAFSSVQQALEAVKHGQFVLVLDDEDRENEGDLIIAADKVTPQKIAYMVEHTSGAHKAA